MANSGCYQITLACESGVQRVLDKVININLPLETICPAIETAKKMSAITVGISAFDGGKMKEMVDVSLHVPTEKGEYGPAEDAHMILDHLVSNYLMRLVRS